MRARVSHKIMIERRITKLRNKVKVDTQRIRVFTLENLQEIFNLAASLARGEFKTQNVDGKPVKVTMGQRQKWARIAAYTAQVINGIAEGFDAHQIDVDLVKLQEMIDEAKAKTEDAAAGKGAAEAGASQPSQG